MEKLGTACQLRLVVLDIDGTLTDPAGDITPPVQAAVRRPAETMAAPSI